MPKNIAWDGTSISLSFVLLRYRIWKSQWFQNAILLGAPLCVIEKRTWTRKLLNTFSTTSAI